MSKEAIRRRILVLRETQKLSEKARKDAVILRRLVHTKIFSNASCFLAYLSHRGEVSTDGLIENVLKRKKVVVPLMKESRMELVLLKDAHRFTPGTFGIRHPVVFTHYQSTTKLDVILVPGVAFDESGHRIGYGGGHFDRLLKKVRATTIGLAYEFQIIDKVPTQTYDVPVDYIVTEKRIISCHS